MGTNTIYKSALVHNIVSTILAYSYAEVCSFLALLLCLFSFTKVSDTVCYGIDTEEVGETQTIYIHFG